MPRWPNLVRRRPAKSVSRKGSLGSNPSLGVHFQMLKKAALKLLKQNLGLKRGEMVIVVTDRKNCPVFKAVCEGVEILGGKLKTLKITNKRAHSSPIPEAKKLFINADAIVAITDKSISHSPETRLAKKEYKVRIISAVEVDKKLFLKGANASQKAIRKINKKLIKILNKHKNIKITSPAGTDIKITRGIKFKSDDGDSTKKGELNNFPYGEICTYDMKDVNGNLVIDFSSVCQSGAKIIIKNSRAVSWNKKAESIISYLKKSGGNSALKIAEFGIGTNPAHKRIIKKIIHDEKIYGSAHIAFGGVGKGKSLVHEDVIILNPTIIAGKKTIVRKGKIL